MPRCWNSMSVFTNPATNALGRAWSHSSLPSSWGIALKTLVNKFSLANIAADIPLCPSKIWNKTTHKSCKLRNYNLALSFKLRVKYRKQWKRCWRIARNSLAVRLDQKVVLSFLRQGSLPILYCWLLQLLISQFAANQSSKWNRLLFLLHFG